MEDRPFTFTVPAFQCGACFATFPGKLSRCPECGIQLLSRKEADEAPQPPGAEEETPPDRTSG